VFVNTVNVFFHIACWRVCRWLIKIYLLTQLQWWLIELRCFTLVKSHAEIEGQKIANIKPVIVNVNAISVSEYLFVSVSTIYNSMWLWADWSRSLMKASRCKTSLITWISIKLWYIGDKQLQVGAHEMVQLGQPWLSKLSIAIEVNSIRMHFLILLKRIQVSTLHAHRSTIVSWVDMPDIMPWIRYRWTKTWIWRVLLNLPSLDSFRWWWHKQPRTPSTPETIWNRADNLEISGTHTHTHTHASAHARTHILKAKN
jgi:hypothetical protein